MQWPAFGQTVQQQQKQQDQEKVSTCAESAVVR